MSIAISVRLDDEAQRALSQLEATGLSRSEAIRRALLTCAQQSRRLEALREEMRALEEDQADREEMREIAALMEMMRAEG